MEKKNIVSLLRVLLSGLGVCLVVSTLYPRLAMSSWSNNPTPVCNAPGNQYGVRLIKVIDGYIVSWQDERRVYRDIYAQKFDVSGNMKWADNGRVIAAGNNGEASNNLLYDSQSLSGIVSDTQGGAIVLWTEDYPCGSGPCGNVWITRVNTNGDVQWGMVPSPGVTIQGTDTAVLLNQHGHADAIAPDGEGGAFGIFDVDAWGSWYVFRINSNGAFRAITSNVVGARGGAHMIYGGNSNGKDYVNIAWWDYGDFAINIEDPEVNYPASTDTLYAPWNKITLSSTPSWWSEPSLISDGAGGAIVAWEDSRNGNTDIFAQKIDSNGTISWTPGGVPIAVQSDSQGRPQLVSDGAGGAVIVWQDSRTIPTRVYAQHVGADGNMLWASDGIPISSTNGLSPKIIRSDDGAYIIVWWDTDANGGTRDYLRAQKVDDAGSPLFPLDSRTPSGGTTGVVISEIYSADFDIASDGSRGLIAVWELGGDIHTRKVSFNLNVGLNPASLDFGIVTVGNSLTKEFRVENLGTGDLTITNISRCTDTGDEFSWSPITLPLTVSPGNGVALSVILGPTRTGVDTGCLEISSIDPFANVALLDLTAVGGFEDVLSGYWADDFIYAIHDAGITGGCSVGPPRFCPDSIITRQQMAVFMETSLRRVPAPACSVLFSDVNPVTVGDLMCRYIEDFAEAGITGGCGSGKYCPDAPVTRAQMAVFIEAALNAPPAGSCAGMYSDVNEETVGDLFCRYIEDFAAKGITGGCDIGKFCPNDPVTRAQMAVFLVTAPPPLNP